MVHYTKATDTVPRTLTSSWRGGENGDFEIEFLEACIECGGCHARWESYCPSPLAQTLYLSGIYPRDLKKLFFFRSPLRSDLLVRDETDVVSLK